MRKHILIVDDEPSFRYGAAVALRISGFKVTETGSPEEACAMIRRKNTFDLLLIDLQMPTMSGLEVIEAARKHGVAVPIVAISAFADSEQINELREQGCADFFDKRTTPREFVWQVVKVLEDYGKPI